MTFLRLDKTDHKTNDATIYPLFKKFIKWSNGVCVGEFLLHSCTGFFPTLANWSQLQKTIQISLAWTKSMYFKLFNNFHIHKTDSNYVDTICLENIDMWPLIIKRIKLTSERTSARDLFWNGSRADPVFHHTAVCSLAQTTTRCFYAE